MRLVTTAGRLGPARGTGADGCQSGAVALNPSLEEPALLLAGALLTGFEFSFGGAEDVVDQIAY